MANSFVLSDEEKICNSIHAVLTEIIGEADLIKGLESLESLFMLTSSGQSSRSGSIEESGINDIIPSYIKQGETKGFQIRIQKSSFEVHAFSYTTQSHFLRANTCEYSELHLRDCSIRNVSRNMVSVIHDYLVKGTSTETGEIRKLLESTHII